MKQHKIGAQRNSHGSKDTQLYLVYHYFQKEVATAAQAANDLGIYHPNLWRYKRMLEREGRLAESKKVTCPITDHRAFLLTADPNKFPAPSQLNLFL